MGIDRVTPGTAAVVLDAGKENVLLHLRDDKPMWSLPGGPPDFGESFADAMVREAREETGVEIKIERLIGVYSNAEYWIFDYLDGNRAHAFAAAFECTVVAGEPRPNMQDSLAVQWFPVAELPENLMPMHSKVIEDCVSGKNGVIF